jgi:hypothetical protein
MYYYIKSEIINSIPLEWFYAEGRSLYQVATMYQNKLLNKEFIIENNDKLQVAFTNFRKNKFKIGEKYHLKCEKTKRLGYMKIYIAFSKNQQVAKFYRQPVELISYSTWEELLPNMTKNKNTLINEMLYLPTETEEYADYFHQV